MSFVDAILESGKKEAEFYHILGCDRLSTKEQIQAEYRARVRDVHPDKVESGASWEANEKFARLQEAYSILSDPSRRSLYDNWLDSPIPGNFEEFVRNANAIKMSTHWIAPKLTPMIETKRESVDKIDRWADGRRYQSDIASKFRNYQL